MLPEDVRRRYDLSSLRSVWHAAAPCPIPIKEAMIAWWGPIIGEYYAGTEGNELADRMAMQAVERQEPHLRQWNGSMDVKELLRMRRG